MADEKKSAGKPAAAKAAAEKKAPKPTPSKAASLVVAGGRSITTGGRILGPGDAISAEDVADIEALIKGGFIVKA